MEPGWCSLREHLCKSLQPTPQASTPPQHAQRRTPSPRPDSLNCALSQNKPHQHKMWPLGTCACAPGWCGPGGQERQSLPSPPPLQGKQALTHREGQALAAVVRRLPCDCALGSSQFWLAAQSWGRLSSRLLQALVSLRDGRCSIDSSASAVIVEALGRPPACLAVCRHCAISILLGLPPPHLGPYRTSLIALTCVGIRDKVRLSPLPTQRLSFGSAALQAGVCTLCVQVVECVAGRQAPRWA